MNITTTNFQRVHANAMEFCMRRSPGKLVTIDKILLHRNGTMAAAVYWAETHACVQVHHVHFDITGGEVRPCVRPREKWTSYRYQILPNGHLKTI